MSPHYFRHVIRSSRDLPTSDDRPPYRGAPRRNRASHDPRTSARLLEASSRCPRPQLGRQRSPFGVSISLHALKVLPFELLPDLFEIPSSQIIADRRISEDESVRAFTESVLGTSVISERTAPMRSDGTIHRIAEKLLRDAGLEEPPVDVEVVAKHLGALVRRESAEGEISGALYRLPEGPVIGVNALHASVRQRFTIAHEIGHLVLHEDPVFVDRMYSAPSPSKRPAYLRDARSSQATDVQEIEANKFAAALLMPPSMIREALDEVSVPVDGEGIETLANLFDVSSQSMGFRLLNLGVPVQQT